MPKFHCQPCNFSTCSTYNYNRHLSTSKHISKCNNSNVINNIDDTDNTDEIDDFSSISHTSSNTDTSSLRIKELENQLKIKELEMQLKIKELENQMKMKEIENQLQIQNLQIKLMSNNNITNDVITEKSTICKIKESKETLLDTLNKKTNVITIEYFQEQCLTDIDINPYIQNIKYNNEIIVIPKYITLEDYSDYIPIDLICKTLEKIPQEKRPIYCSDVRRRHFYIKTKDGWIKPNETQINEIIEKLYWSAYSIIGKAFGQLKQISKNINIYEKIYHKNNLDDRAELNCHRILLTLYPQTKEEKKLHYAKLKVKLSEMTNDKDTGYIIDKKNSSNEDFNEEEYDNEYDEEKN